MTARVWDNVVGWQVIRPSGLQTCGRYGTPDFYPTSKIRSPTKIPLFGGTKYPKNRNQDCESEEVKYAST